MEDGCLAAVHVWSNSGFRVREVGIENGRRGKDEGWQSRLQWLAHVHMRKWQD